MQAGSEVHHYRLHSGGLVNVGVRSLGDALAAMRLHYDGEGEEALIGFCRSDTDFVEIGSEGGGRFLVNSDRLRRHQGWWDSLFGPRRFRFSFHGLSQAEYVIRSYYSGSRENFEDLLLRMQDSAWGGGGAGVR